ncbi:MAG: hypothetical protein HOB05_02225 [Bacteroidetes bacterium]|nr:hypothetical protein [Bacteroidota bacterium]
MKALTLKNIAISIILLLSFTYAQAQLESGIQSEDIPAFNIDFPHTEFDVKRSTSKVSELGGVIITNWILQGKNSSDPYMYFVAHNKFPADLEDQVFTDKNFLNTFFQAALKSSALKLGGSDFQFTEIDFENYNGMESVCKVFSGEGVIKSRVYKINDNIFMISAGGKNIDLNSVNNFLDSFYLK